jgi:hypothetical protein
MNIIIITIIILLFPNQLWLPSLNFDIYNKYNETYFYIKVYKSNKAVCYYNIIFTIC